MAQAAATLKNATDAKTITVAYVTLNDVNLYVKFTIEADSDAQLTDGNGDSYVIANGRAYPNAATKVVGTYTVSGPEWFTTKTGSYSDNDYSEAVINSLGAADYTVTMASSGVTLQTATTETTKTGFSATAVEHKFNLHVAAGGALSITSTPAATNMTIAKVSSNNVAKGQFNIRATSTDTSGTTLTAEADHADTISVSSITKVVAAG